MNQTVRRSLIPLLLLSCPLAAAPPADTWFSLAVSENSHNHYGENLLFLDFVEQPDAAPVHPLQVLSTPKGESSPQLDGNLADWEGRPFTRLSPRVMNNYPLDEHRDAVPTTIEVASIWDDEDLWLAIRWEDANHDPSTNRNRWIYHDGSWHLQPHTPAAATTPAARALNNGAELDGVEDEDQLFIMFPIVDSQHNFREGGLGCGGYCHANLILSPHPDQAQIGDGVAMMHTALPDDIADLWHWTATRERLAGTLKDGYLDYGDTTYNGRKVDDGEAPFRNNALDQPFQPSHFSRSDFEAGLYGKTGHRTESLEEGDNLMPIPPDATFANGDSLPFYIHGRASGSRADVTTAARFDSESGYWSIELRRKRETGDRFDRQFSAGNQLPVPTIQPIVAGDPQQGELLFSEKACAACHGERGEGLWQGDGWLYPRNQRASGPLISNIASPYRPSRQLQLVSELKRYDEPPVASLMPFVRLSHQQAEDIAAWLQLQDMRAAEPATPADSQQQ